MRPIAAVLVLGSLALSSASAQTKIGDVSIGTKFGFKSAHLDGEIPVRIHLPPAYEDGASRCSVLYLLEIADDFVFASASADFLARCGRIPGLIVVSIDVDNVAGPPQGMIDFMEKELFPYVERTYRTEPRRILYGHSGRSFAALFILLNRPEMFEGYICPGLGLSWPVEQGRMDFSAMAAERFAGLKSLPKSFVFSLGDEEKFFAGIERFISVLKDKAPSDLRWTYLQMPGDDHNSTKLKTLYQGLEFVFKAR
jgi:enterochelin esterase-like enzyme